MKDEFITVGIFLLLLCLFVWNFSSVKGKTQNITRIIDSLEALESVSEKDCTKLKEEWDREKKILLYFSPHQNIKQIDECIMFFCRYTHEKNIPWAMHYLKKARSLLRELADREKISLDNIF